MIIQNVTKQLHWHGMVRLACKGAVHLLKQCDMGQCGLAEESFASRNISFRKRLTARSELDITAFGVYEGEKSRGVDDGQEIVHRHEEFLCNAVQILLAAAIIQQFQQTCDRTRPRMRQHAEWLFRLRTCGGKRSGRE